MTLWHGRFDQPMADSVAQLSVSIGYDAALWADDLRASRAHVHGLGRAALLSEDEMIDLLAAIATTEAEFAAGTFSFAPSDEDIHTAIERRLSEITPVGAKVHTARSRNDQVATAFRLWARRNLLEVLDGVLGLASVLIERASTTDLRLPGYTHLQRAQAVPLGQVLLAHAWALERDGQRLLDAVGRLNISPLGAGAIAGSSLNVDPEAVAKELGFSGPFENSMDVTADRDFVAEGLSTIALLAVHLSRMGEEMVLWTTEEFGFAVLDDAYATGSSMLPQKKNADVAELARAKAGRLIGNATGFLATLKGLPLAYNRDLQEDKEPFMDSVAQIKLILAALSGLYATVSWKGERMAEAADDQLLAAVDLADWLVKRGMPFRAAHAEVGALVRESIDTGGSLADLVAKSAIFGREAADLLLPGASLEKRTTPGGAHTDSVIMQAARLASAVDALGGRSGAIQR
ncbi:MAG: argininosuccinate lyase [Actinobacteria bacterium]|nr:argininosuccinate lyase [Actinomycetota bacterium]